MKKVIFAIGLIVSLVACSGAVKEEAPVADSTAVSCCAVDSTVCPLIDTTAVDSVKVK